MTDVSPALKVPTRDENLKHLAELRNNVRFKIDHLKKSAEFSLDKG